MPNRIVMLLAVTLPACAASAQTQPATPTSFEVASVKEIPDSDSFPPGFSMSPRRSGGAIRWVTNASFMVRYAYDRQRWRIGGASLPDAYYAIDAKTDESATDQQIRQMFQTLFADRFKMAVHRETRELTGYALVVAKNGPKIKEFKPDDAAAPMPDYFKGKPEFEGRTLMTVEHGLALTGRRVTMAQLAEALQEPLEAFVVDRTGMPGKYFFALRFGRDNRPNDEFPSLFVSVQEQLGLKLEKTKGPVEMLAVDHMEKMPTEN